MDNADNDAAIYSNNQSIPHLAFLLLSTGRSVFPVYSIVGVLALLSCWTLAGQN